MTTTTVTPVAPIVTDMSTPVIIVPTADTLSAAVAAVSTSTNTDDTARGKLAEIVRARYVYHATRQLPNGKTRAMLKDGVLVLPEEEHKEVASMLWLDATGHLHPVKAKDRTPGERSLGQYISNYGKVAQNLDYGIDHMDSVEAIKSARADIKDAEAAAKANEEQAAEALAELAARDRFREWLATQPQRLQTAFKDVTHALKGDAAPHLAGFLSSLSEVSE